MDIFSHTTHTHIHTHTHSHSSTGPNLIPRPSTFENSPFLRPRKGRSINIPGVGPVKLRHGASHSYYGSGCSDPDKIPDDLMSLEDFLAESEKTPNRVRDTLSVCVFGCYVNNLIVHLACKMIGCILMAPSRMNLQNETYLNSYPC